MKPTCETCRWWKRIDDDSHGLCRRHPPQVVLRPTLRIDEHNEYDLECKFLGRFPIVWGEEFCGEHTPIPVEGEE